MTDLTLSANQEWSQWKNKQYKWNEQASSEKSLIEDIEENLNENVEVFAKWLKTKVSLPSAAPTETQINLRPFDMNTMRLEKIWYRLCLNLIKIRYNAWFERDTLKMLK